MLELGERYLFGWGGAEQDYRQSYEYFKQAAEKGVPDALCHLADFYLDPERGIVQRDFTIVPFVVAAGFYLVMTLVLTWVFQRLEKHYARYEA